MIHKKIVLLISSIFILCGWVFSGGGGEALRQQSWPVRDIIFMIIGSVILLFVLLIIVIGFGLIIKTLYKKTKKKKLVEREIKQELIK
ncbi:MAG: hypothetical protein WBC20_06865 [Candidatus Aminicenantaceae bacterium]